MNKLLASVKYVSEHSDHVKINVEAIDQYVATFKPAAVDHWMKACPFEYRPLFNIDDEIDRHFLQDAQAFCFWGYPTKWTTTYENKQLDGWWALLACFQKVIEHGTPLLTGDYLSQMTLELTKNIFKGSPEIPLLVERQHIFNQIGLKLMNKYEGRFHNFYAKSSRDAIKLLDEIVTEFPAFDDTSMYKGRTIYFYKKAQLLVYQLATKLVSPSYGRIENIMELTGKADYKIPGLMRQLGILVYDKELSQQVDGRTPLIADSMEEIEIRANMLWVNHLICNKLSSSGHQLSAMELNDMLWVQSQTKSPIDKPYHLTLTVDY